MMKVILETAGKRTTDLLPEYTSLREAFEHFHMNGETMLITVNGTPATEEDLDRKLIDFGSCTEEWITAAPKPADEKNESDRDYGIKLSSAEAKAYDALIKVRAILEEAIDSLGTPVKAEELPF